MSFRSTRLFNPILRAKPSISSHFQHSRHFHASLPKMAIQHVNSLEAFNKTINSNDVVVVDAFAEWCGPCKAIAPKVEALSRAFEGKAIFAKFDVDEVPDLALELGIRAMPTFLLFKKGEKAGELVGANPNSLEQLIVQHTS